MVNSHVKNEDTEEQKKNQIKQPPQELDQLLEAGHTSYCYNSGNKKNIKSFVIFGRLNRVRPN